MATGMSAPPMDATKCRPMILDRPAVMAKEPAPRVEAGSDMKAIRPVQIPQGIRGHTQQTASLPRPGPYSLIITQHESACMPTRLKSRPRSSSGGYFTYFVRSKLHQLGTQKHDPEQE